MDDLKYDYKFLKEARLAKGLSSDSVAFDLCLAERQIHSIENNLPDYFYSPTIKLACIKKYAEKLGLDIDVVFYKKERIYVQEKILEKNRTKTSRPIKMLATNVQAQTKSPKVRKSHTKISHGNNQSNHVITELSVEYIRDNLSNKITIADLRKLTGYSERSLQIVFKKELNQSPFEYIEEQRLLKAKELIEKHKKSRKISAIAQDVGFFHLGRFSMNFKQRFGISPSLLLKD
jgi:AraC-like DNA-binding protein/DNA-binding XRE family transcriptional regulator